MCKLTKTELKIIEAMKQIEPLEFWAESLIDLLKWDRSVKYPERRYRLPAYSIMERMERKGIVKRQWHDLSYWRDGKRIENYKFTGYKLTEK